MSKDKVTRIRKDRTVQAKTGQFKNLVNAAKAGQISMVEAQKAIRKLVQAKKGGGKVQAMNTGGNPDTEKKFSYFGKKRTKPIKKKMKLYGEEAGKNIKKNLDSLSEKMERRKISKKNKKTLPTEFRMGGKVDISNFKGQF